MAKNNDGSSMLGALVGNYGENLTRRAKQDQNALEARRENALFALSAERDALLSSGLKYDLRGNPVEQRVSEIDALLSSIRGAQGKTLDETDPSLFGKVGRGIGTVIEQTLGGQALADVMTPSDASDEAYQRNQVFASMVPAVASLGRGMPGRMVRSGKAFVKAGQNTSSFSEALNAARAGGAKAPKASGMSRGFGPLTPAAEGGGVGAPSMIRKASGSKLVSDEQALASLPKSKSGMQPYIDAAGGDVVAGRRAYEASLKAGKNVAIPSPSGAAPASPPTPPPNAPQSGHVSPRGASGGAAGMENPGPTGFSAPMPGVPTSGTPVAGATTPASSTLRKLLTSASTLTTGAIGGMGLQALINSKQREVSAEQAQPAPQPTPQQPQLQLPLDDSSSVANAYGAANTGSTPNAVQPAAPSFESQLLALLSGGGQQQAPSGPSPMISDEDIAQIQKLVGAVAPQQTQQVAPQQKPSLTSNILNAIGKGLIAGGTGDPRAAFAVEDNARQEALAQEQLRQSRQQFSPQQQFVNQILAQVLGNRLGVSGQKELLGAQNQASQQAQARQIAAQLMLMDREQQAAIARDDRETAVKYELQKRDAMARLEQIKAQTTGQLQMFADPSVQKALDAMRQASGGAYLND